MPIYYDFKKGPQKDEQGILPRLYPHVIPQGKKTFEDLIDYIAEATTFTRGELEGMMMILTDQIISSLLDSYRVQLGDLGYFSLKLTTDQVVTDKNEIRAESIRVDNVQFHPSAKFKKILREEGKVERTAGKKFMKSGNLPIEKRKQLLIEYLKNEPYITRTQYSSLTGVLKNKALRDLHSFTKESLLICCGKKPHLWFMLAQKNNMED